MCNSHHNLEILHNSYHLMHHSLQPIKQMMKGGINEYRTAGILRFFLEVYLANLYSIPLLTPVCGADESRL